MPYKRKNDGRLFYLKIVNGRLFTIKEVEYDYSEMKIREALKLKPDETRDVCFTINQEKFERDYEKVEEEKPMYQQSIAARCVNCGLKQTYLPQQEAPICKNNGCNGHLSTCENMFDEKKPMHNFKVGDRVAIYGTIGYSGIEFGELVCDGFQSTIKSIEENYLIVIHNDRPLLWSKVHYKQCRKLKKRGRKRVWVDPKVYNELNNIKGIHNNSGVGEYAINSNWIEFVEVRKK